ncbi:MAG TPA: SCO family protein [Nocardioidaceae bacterium]|jgi:protein SCO1/2|nr:SCO family protein [Nocardioidaceae bacterium]
MTSVTAMAAATAMTAVAAAALLAGCASSTDDEQPAAIVVTESTDGGQYAGIELEQPYPLPDTTLTDDNGDRIRLPADLEAPVQAYFFGYTNCPDICPLIMSDLALAVARLPADLADKVQVVLVSSDPARDDPAALRAYLERFDPDFTGLTGDLDAIRTLADTMGVALEEGKRLPGGGYEVAHGAQVVGYIGDRGVVVWTERTSVEDLSSDLARMAAAADTPADAPADAAAGRGR